MKLSINSFQPHGAHEIPEGSVSGYGLNQNHKITAHYLTGAAYGIRHLKLAFFSEPRGFELGLSRCYHVAIGLVECIPIIGAVVAVVDKAIFHKKFGRYAEYDVFHKGNDKRSASKMLEDYGFSIDGEGELICPRGAKKEEDKITLFLEEGEFLINNKEKIISFFPERKP